MEITKEEYNKAYIVAKYLDGKIELTGDSDMYYVNIILNDVYNNYWFDVYNRNHEIALYYNEMNDKLKELIRNRIMQVYDLIGNRLENRANYLIDLLEAYNKKI